MLVEPALHLDAEDVDLPVRRGDHRDHAGHQHAARGGHRGRCDQLLGVQGVADLFGAGRAVMPPCPLERRADLGPGQPPPGNRVGRLAQQLERVRSGQIVEGVQGGG